LRAIPAILISSAVISVSGHAFASDAMEKQIWSGFYVGAFGGVTSLRTDYDVSNSGSSGAALSNNERFAAETLLSAAFNRRGEPFQGGNVSGGAVVGYDWQSGPVVVGAFADFTYTGSRTDIYSDVSGTQARYQLGLNHYGTVQARFGIALDPVLLYVHGGYAYGESQLDFMFSGNNRFRETYSTDGYVVGFGTEFAVSERVTLSTGYSFTHFANTPINGRFNADEYVVDEEISLHQLRFGLNFRPFGSAAGDTDRAGSSPRPAWSGLYLGGYTGIGSGGQNFSFDNFMSVGPDTLTAEERNIANIIGNLFIGANRDGGISLSGAVAGAQAGYDVRNGSLIVGGFADITYLGHTDDIFPAYNGQGSTNIGTDYVGTVQVRAGAVFDRALFYAHGGYAFGRTSIEQEGEFVPTVSWNNWKNGFVLGAGAEYALNDRLSLVADYSFIDLANEIIVSGRSGGDSFSTVTDEAELHVLKLGLNVRLGQ